MEDSGTNSADDVQRQIWHKVEQQDTDFKQRHTGVMDGIKLILGQIEPFPMDLVNPVVCQGE